jgi:anti-sigma regulatory factor (Ser/Thr protein kinase)
MMDRTRVFEAQPRRLAEVRRFIAECARGGPFEQVLDDLLIATSEASANAVLHSGTRQFRVTWHEDADSVVIMVTDDGVYGPGVGMPEADSTSHRGIQLMSRTMSEITIRKGTPDHVGTEVRMVRTIG